ncbi:Leucine-rich repeat, partial [Dillenia turbinata]
MHRRVLIYIASVCFLIEICNGGDFSETTSFSIFIQAVDPEKVLGIVGKGRLRNPCLYPFKGVECDFQANSILEIRLQNLNLSGVIDAESLCELPHLQVVNLAQNFIKGGIPNSISSCTKLRYLNLSNNLLEGSIPFDLTQLKNLKKLDISNNHFTGISKNFEIVAKHTMKHESHYLEIKSNDNVSASSPSSVFNSRGESSGTKKYTWPYRAALVVGVVLAASIACYVNGRSTGKTKEEEKVIYVEETSIQVAGGKHEEGFKSEEKRSDLVFFVNESERFTLEDLLESAADLQSQSLCSSLYKVTLKNNAVFAVKRLKKVQVSLEEFGETMRMVGSMKHRNLRPLLGYHSTDDQKLLIYKFQSNGSLLNLLENYTIGKREFSWRLRLSIASGIARGLDYIYRRSNDGEESIPHGNLKPSNIILSEIEEPLISEYGISKFLDPIKTCKYANNGYMAPEKAITEQGDVYSFGIILLELLTGKIVEKTGIDLPKWVRSMVREEWTGEVFDKEIDKAEVHWAFPLLNISLKCVSHLPETRPSVAEVLEKIEEVIMSVQEECSSSSYSSIESVQHDWSLLHTVIH